MRFSNDFGVSEASSCLGNMQSYRTYRQSPGVAGSVLYGLKLHVFGFRILLNLYRRR